MASLGGISSSGLNFTGLSTGIDTAKIVDGLTRINQQRINALKARQADAATHQAAFAALQGKLFDLQAKASGLARSAGGAFDARKADSSDPTALTAAAGSAAVPGTYTITVGALAQANQIASGGFADPNAQIKQGTLTVQVGAGTATTVTIDSRNNTLQGLADAINAAGGDVRASVINDGSATPYRLMLSATRTGAANAIAVTNNLTGGGGADIDPTAKTIQAAADVQVTLGSGAGALTVSSPSNQVNGLIPGVSLSLLRADPTKAITLSVSNDTTGAAKAVQDFVDSYNGVVGYLNDQSKYDAKTQSAGLLLGDRDASALANELAGALTASIPGLAVSANRLSSVGLSFANDGKLVLDSGKLNQALAGQTGATVADLKRLFGVSGTSDNPGVAFVLGTDKTRATAGSAYQVTVTAPATRAVATATSALSGSVIITPPDTALMLKLNGLAAAGVNIEPGTYTPDALAALLQQKINAVPALAGNPVSVGLDGTGRLQITSQMYGSGSRVEFAGGGALAALGFTGTETGAGTDVAGTFTANDQTEAATGSGQVLSGNAGNRNTDGLQVRVTLPGAGSANVTVTQGLAGRLNQVLGKYLDASTGRLKAINDGYQKTYDDLDKTIARQNDVLQEKTQQLQVQFAAMEAAVNNLKGLQSQLASLVPTTTR